MSTLQLEHQPQRHFEPMSPLEVIDAFRSDMQDRTAVYPLDMELPSFAEGLENCHVATVDDNRAGAFKWRGVLYAMHRKRVEQGIDHFYMASAGNHAIGGALGALALGVGVTVVMPKSASEEKKSKPRRLNEQVKVELYGDTVDEALEYVEYLAPSANHTVHPFNDQHVIAGQGTMLNDILRLAPDTRHIVVATGGGGAAAGMAAELHRLGNDQVKLHLVEAEGNDSMSKSLLMNGGRVYEASGLNQRAGGSAVMKCGELCLRMLASAGYTHTDVVQVANSELESVAESYLYDRERLLRQHTSGYEPTTLVAFAGLRRLVEEGRVKGKAVVLGTGHNAPIEHAFGTPSLRRTTRIASAQVPLRSLIRPR